MLVHYARHVVEYCIPIFVELFNAQDIAYKYRGVKQRYDGTISCELPLNRCKERKAGETI